MESYLSQVRALVEGGVDVLLPETTFDTLNLKAAIFAMEEFFSSVEKVARDHVHHHYGCIG